MKTSATETGMLEISELPLRLVKCHCDGEKGCLVAALIPTFSWQADGPGRGRTQKAFRLIVSESNNACESGNGDLWDSGKVESDKVHAIYEGKALVPDTSYSWRLWLWDEAENQTSSTVERFRTAMCPENWLSEWITCSHDSPVIRFDFDLPCQITEAIACSCGLGYSELYLNGNRVGDAVLDPAWTDYDKRMLYTAHDVTALLREGPNTVGVMMGVGWYAQMVLGRHDATALPLLFQMSVKLGDGTVKQILSSRKGWLSAQSPITKSGVYYGEDYDARLEIPRWNEPEWKEGDKSCRNEVPWTPVFPAEPPEGQLLPQKMEPIRPVGTLLPKSSWVLADGSRVFDMGQNFAGWACVSVSGPAGSSILMKYAEMVHEDGSLNTINLRSARAADHYILKGNGTETYQPRFTYHGFRYVQVILDGCSLLEESLTGIVVRSAVSSTGVFQCSDPLINAIQNACQWTEGSNLHSLPTDCPQRDERLFWLNDMTVRCEEAMYNFDVSSLFANAVTNIADGQGAVTGAISDTAPRTNYGRQPADPVSTSFLLIPWNLWRFFEMKKPMVDHYENLKRWQGYLERCSNDSIVMYSHYGDWASPVAFLQAEGHSPVSAITPGDYMSTGFFLFNARLLADMAGVLGKSEDQAYYLSQAETIKMAMNSKYYNGEEATYSTGSQACQTFALYLEIVEAEHKERVLERLARDVEEKNTHLSTGNLCSRYILDVLSRNGRIDLAFALATQRTYPSWGYMIENGATTIWERWEHVTEGFLAGMASYNHPMYASVSSWYYTTLAGIQPQFDHPGFSRFDIAPIIPSRLDSAEAELMTVRGLIRIAWRKKGSSFELETVIPFNSTAVLALPGRSMKILEGDAVIWENGCFLGGEGISHAAQDEGTGLKFILGSGSYYFILEDWHGDVALS